MTEQEYRKLHEAHIRRLSTLDRQYASDRPDSPEEAEWLEKRMKEVLSMEHNDTSEENLPF
jgi:hypothetical protein